MKEPVHAGQFLCVKHAMQYVNGHADVPKPGRSNAWKSSLDTLLLQIMI